MKTIEFLYTHTHENQPQMSAKAHCNDSVLKDMETLAEFATGKDVNKKDLVKISCCVHTDEPETLPDWFIQCHGKLYFKNGELDKD